MALARQTHVEEGMITFQKRVCTRTETFEREVMKFQVLVLNYERWHPASPGYHFHHGNYQSDDDDRYRLSSSNSQELKGITAS